MDVNKTEQFRLVYKELDVPEVTHTLEAEELLKSDVIIKSQVSLAFDFSSDVPHLADRLVLRIPALESGRLSRQRQLPVTTLSETAGYVTSPNYDGISADPGYPGFYTGHFTLECPGNLSLVVNFMRFDIAPIESKTRTCKDFVALEVGSVHVWKLCGSRSIQPQVYRDAVWIKFHSNDLYHTGLGFKMAYVVLPRHLEPQEISEGVYNCSVPHFDDFAPALRCNMATECVRGEDEKHCEFSYESQDCGQGLFDAGTKCYRLVQLGDNFSWNEAYFECRKHSEQLITLATAAEEAIFKQLLSVKKNSNCVFIGLHQSAEGLHDTRPHSEKSMYERVWRWTDDRTAFLVDMKPYLKTQPPLCAIFRPREYPRHFLTAIPCHEVKSGKPCDVVCEKHKQGQRGVQTSSLPQISSLYLPYGLETITEVTTTTTLKEPLKTVWKAPVVTCPGGHVTRDFLSCDPESQCGVEDHMTLCQAGTMAVPLFVCELSKQSVHYSLVCDHIQHCSDNSDETFCYYEPCRSVTCKNGQCLPIGRECDGQVNCADFSDEQVCGDGYLKPPTDHWGFSGPPLIKLSVISPPFFFDVVHFGNYTLKYLNDSNDCPSTHFLCPGGVCLPLYLRCNNIDDCPGREDEAGCDTYTCPGFYRCRASKVCLPSDLLCDGVRHCFQQDDEMLCDLDPCPDVCQCQGLAFVCSRSFNSSLHPDLRLLDASGSGMSLENLMRNELLVYADLSHCAISKFERAAIPNLRYLDLSWNQLSHVDMSQFRDLKNLRVLVLSGNPVSVSPVSSILSSDTMVLRTLDLSYTRFETFNSTDFAACPRLKNLNMSWSQMTEIDDGGFQTTPLLEVLDMRHSPLTTFPAGLLRHLTALKVVHTNNFKLCCRAVLPDDFNLKNCHSKHDQLSSCQNLFRVDAHRICIWIFAVMAIVGNVSCFVSRTCQKNSNLGSFGVLISSLNMADFFNGVYLAVIGMTDFMYQGRYLFHDLHWRNSVMCRAAGFLALLSSEVSAFNICLMTLDRVLVLCFPFSKMHFRRLHALVSCVVIWTISVVLAMIPLLPFTSHWQFFSQSSICIPLPFRNGDSFQGYNWVFSITIVLNFTLFVITAAGEIFAFWFAASLDNDSTPSAKNTTVARRLITVILTNFVCWFPIGLLGILSFYGSNISEELNIAAVIFAMPVNSALNPFLYTYGVVMEKREKMLREKLIKQLKSQLACK